MQKISSNFIGNFKIGDNINYNLKILQVLYDFYEELEEEKRKLLHKPIILIIVSIIEAIFHDFHMRVKVFTREGVSSLATGIIEYIRGKEIDELDKYIKSARKHNLLKVKNLIIYEFIDDLRKIRNRIHIQNTKGYFESDECEVFTRERKMLAEMILEKVLFIMTSHHSRGSALKHVQDFTLPWDKHDKNEIKRIFKGHIQTKKILKARELDL